MLETDSSFASSAVRNTLQRTQQQLRYSMKFDLA